MRKAITLLPLLALIAAMACSKDEPLYNFCLTYKIQGQPTYQAIDSLVYTGPDGEKRVLTEVSLPWEKTVDFPARTEAELRLYGSFSHLEYGRSFTIVSVSIFSMENDNGSHRSMGSEIEDIFVLQDTTYQSVTLLYTPEDY